MSSFSVCFVGVYLMVFFVELSDSRDGKSTGINGAFNKTYKKWNLVGNVETDEAKTKFSGMDTIALRKRRSEELFHTNAMANLRKLKSTDGQRNSSDAATKLNWTTAMYTESFTQEKTETISDASQRDATKNLLDRSYDSEDVTSNLRSYDSENVTQNLLDRNYHSENVTQNLLDRNYHSEDVTPSLFDRGYDSEDEVTCQPILENTTESTNASLDTRNQTRQSRAGLLSKGWVSAATYQAINDAILKASLPLLLMVIVLCFFSVVVYSMKAMKCPTSVYLISINVTEMLYAAVSLIAYITGNIYGDKAMVSYIYLNIGLYLNNYVGIALKRSTFCVTSFVSAERMIAVAFPLKSKHFRLSRNPALIVVLTIFSSFVFHLFSALKYAIVPYQAALTNETLWKLEFTDLKDPIESWSLSSKVIFVYTPLILTLLLNFGTVFSIRRHNQARRQLNVNDDDRSDARERQTTIVILVSTFVFVFLALPTVTNSLVSNLATGYGPYTKEHYLFISIIRVGGFCGFLSSATNFLFYMTLSSKFRQSFLTLVPCISKQFRKRQQITRSNTNMTQLSGITENSTRSVSST